MNVLSTMHRSLKNLGLEDGKSEIILFYNQTKSGVDTLDKLVRGYSSKQKYQYWPCHIFFMLTDCSIHVAYKIHQMVNGSEESHYHFKKVLSYELVLPLVHCRAQISGL